MRMKRSIAEMIMKSTIKKPIGREILVTFTDGESVIYTDDIIDILKDSPDVENIADAETGEILFHR